MTISNDDRSNAAQMRADAIRQRIDNLAEVPALIATAYQAEDWKTLGYESWEAYVSEEFGTSLLKLNTAMRKQWTRTLKDAGMSTREIAPVTNVSQATASRDSRESFDSRKPPRRIPKSNGRRIKRFRIPLPDGDGPAIISLAYDATRLYCPHCESEV